MRETDITSRKGFLRAALGMGAGAMAARMDPEGEPLPDTAPLIVVNAPGAVLSNLMINAGDSRRTAIQLKSTDAYLVGNSFWSKA
jgi:hypothetical protein